MKHVSAPFALPFAIAALSLPTALHAQSNYELLMKADEHLVKGTEAMKRSNGTNCRYMQIAFDELGIALTTAQSIDYVSGDEKEQRIWDAKRLLEKKVIAARKDLFDRMEKSC